MLIKGMIKMMCENCFCIYWDKGECTLEKIMLDAQGSCQDCVFIDLSDNDLEKAREKTPRRYDREYGRWE